MNSSKEQQKNNRLVRGYSNYDCTAFTDKLSLVAHNVENSFLQCGFIPGKDYVCSEIMDLSLKVMLAWEKGDLKTEFIFDCYDPSYKI